MRRGFSPDSFWVLPVKDRRRRKTMSSETLFDLPEPDRPSRGDVRKAAHADLVRETVALRRKWTIYTHYAGHMGEHPWTAMCVPLVVSWVENGYTDGVPLTEDERHPVDLISHYCSRLDDLRMLVTGRTQHEAVRAAVAGMDALKLQGLDVEDRPAPTVFVDELMPCLPKPGWRWDHASHLMIDTDTDREALHVFADIIGLKREWEQVSQGGMLHYDLNASRRAQAVAAGAIEIDRTATVELIRKWREQTKR